MNVHGPDLKCRDLQSSGLVVSRHWKRRNPPSQTKPLVSEPTDRGITRRVVFNCDPDICTRRNGFTKPKHVSTFLHSATVTGSLNKFLTVVQIAITAGQSPDPPNAGQQFLPLADEHSRTHQKNVEMCEAPLWALNAPNQLFQVHLVSRKLAWSQKKLQHATIITQTE